MKKLLIIILIILIILIIGILYIILTSPTFWISLVGGIAGVFLGIAPADNKLALVIYGGIVFLIAAYISKKIIKFIEKKLDEKEEN